MSRDDAAAGRTLADLYPYRIGSGCCWYCNAPDTVAPLDRGRIPELCPDPACRAGWEQSRAWTGLATGPVLATHIVVGNEWMPLPDPAPVPVREPHVDLEDAIAPPVAPPLPIPKPGPWLLSGLLRRRTT